MMALFPFVAMLLYLAASIITLLWLKGRMPHCKGWLFVLGIAALVVHGILLHRWIDITVAGQNLTALNMFSLITWLVSILVLSTVLSRQIEALVIFIFPLSAVSILLVMLFPARFIINTTTNPQTLFHIILAVVTTAVLSVAGLLALLLFFEERFLRYKRGKWLIQNVAPLQTMETWLFQAIGLGIVLLTIVIATSLYFYLHFIFASPVLLQKTILAMMAWVVFSILLWGRLQWGWRGNKAIFGTLAGMVLLFIAYFGSKFLLEMLW